MSLTYLTEAEVAEVLTIDLALDAVEAGFRKLGLDEGQNAPRQRVQTDHVMLHVLPASAKTLGALGFKAYTTTRQGAKFHVTLFDSKTGAMTALIEADALGQYRTGAASAVATKRLARKEASTVGCIGTGKQARTQLLAVCKVRAVKRVTVFGRDADRRKAFAAQMTAECGVEVVPAETAEAAVKGQEIVITATNAREPVLFGEWLAPGAHVNLVGSNFKTSAEADDAVFRRAALVVVDHKEQAKAEAGDFVAALGNGALHWGDIIELAPLVVGRYPGRETPDDVTVFKSLGLGIEDVSLAVRVLQLARERGLGKVILD